MLVGTTASIVLFVTGVTAGQAEDLPPAGRSLFDELTVEPRGPRVVQEVPFPFAALMARLERQVGPDALGGGGVKAVLIPLGRSLQRNASIEDAFRFPRVVAAVVGEPTKSDALRLKDRLFLGYHEKAGVLEVISYNPAAGRYEFQVVKDYRAGGKPRVFYARRAVCTACHQNEAPIFSRPSWDETNANPRISARLAQSDAQRYGVTVRRGVDQPNAIDDAVQRANRLAFAQRLWREGCGAAADPLHCRARVFAATLDFRRGKFLADNAAGAAFGTALHARWGKVIALPDPNIPNRDPFGGEPIDPALDPDAAALRRAAEIVPAFDPLSARPPLERWQTRDPQTVLRWIRLLADSIAPADLQSLHRKGIDDASLDRVLQALESDARASAENIFDPRAFDADALMHALLRRLGVRRPPPRLEALHLQPAIDGESGAAGSVSSGLQAFYRYCALCHDTREAAPPGFLHGDSAAVERNLVRCAPRILYRLDMWQREPAARRKTPMPPSSAGAPPPPETLQQMRDFISALLDTPATDVMRKTYEALPACRIDTQQDAALPH